MLITVLAFLGFGLMNVYIAANKGFNRIIWFFAGGILGLIVLIFLPSAEAVDDEPEKYKRRKNVGNAVGVLLILLSVYVAIDFLR